MAAYEAPYESPQINNTINTFLEKVGKYAHLS